MPLDALQIGGQVKALSAHLESNQVFRRERLPLARETLRSQAASWESLATLAARSQSRLATPIEPLDAVANATPAPEAYTVMATDGSQIEPDHHGIAEYFLINLGSVRHSIRRLAKCPAGDGGTALLHRRGSIHHRRLFGPTSCPDPGRTPGSTA